MAKAYVLIETSGGRSAQVLQTLRGRPGITAVDAVTDVYDVIAIVEGQDSSEVDRIVEREIRGVDGVARTVTCRVKLA